MNVDGKIVDGRTDEDGRAIAEGMAIVPRRLRLDFRWVGMLPVIFFAARFVEYVWIAQTPEQILWCCHVSNLTLGIGILAQHPRSIRISSLWILVGLPPWALDMVLSGLITPVSILSHLGGAVVALVALQRVRVSGSDWWPALFYFLVLQQLSRILTVPGPLTNVNVAHFAYGPWKDLITIYWLYILVNSILAALLLLTLERILRRVFPLGTPVNEKPV
jgi:hypothetical protein